MDITSETQKKSSTKDRAVFMKKKWGIFVIIFQCLCFSLWASNHIIIDSIVYNNGTDRFLKDSIINLIKAQDVLIFSRKVQNVQFYLTQSDTTRSYILESYNENWITTKDDVIRYDQIPAGKYKIRIRSLDEEEFMLAIEFSSSITEKWWFIPLLTSCLMLIPLSFIYFVILNKSRKELHVETVRNQISSDLHDDVGADLSAIKNHLKNIERKMKTGKNASPILIKAQKYVEQIIINLRDTVWAINPSNENINELFIKLQWFSKSLFVNGEVKVVFDNTYNIESKLFIDMEQRYNLLMIYKEILNNVYKHAQANCIHIKIWNVKTELHIKIEDDGIGFDDSLVNDGNGLKNFQIRAVNNHIDIIVDSVIGKGTNVNLVVHSL